MLRPGEQRRGLNMSEVNYLAVYLNKYQVCLYKLETQDCVDKQFVYGGINSYA